VRGTLWNGRTLYDLYSEAFTPWEWHPRLRDVAAEEGLDFFSTPFDDTAVDFLEELGVVAHKVASFENVDLPLLRKVASTGKPLIVSTGMATLAEVDEAVQTIRGAGGSRLALLKCTSAYPCTPDTMNLRTIPHLSEAFGVPVGLSDHSMEAAVPAVAVALGACIVEKHFTLDRAAGGPDSAFSLEPHEFRAMVNAVRVAEQALGGVSYGGGPAEEGSKAFRRSLFIVQDVRAGEAFTPANVRSIRPGYGLHTRHLEQVMGRVAARDVARGTPLAWELVSGGAA
jgi:N-acetylneuraminate synthase